MHDQDITITMVDARQRERRFQFDNAQICIVGRAHDCDISAADSDENLVISRHHCLLEIDPPRVRIHDLGSTNGTYVNGVRIPRGRTKNAAREGIPLFDGDEVALGPVVLRVQAPSQTPTTTQQTDFALEFASPPVRQPGGTITERTIDNRKMAFR
jgi:eukaryotic-like serine/threonine-protein kinase